MRPGLAMIAAAAALVFGLAGLPGIAHADPPQTNIVGGTEVPDGKYPFMASLQYQDEKGTWHHGCGATLIDARGVLLTARHCLGLAEPGKGRVVVGRTRHSATDGYVRGIARAIGHPHPDADVALLFLDDEVPDVTPIQLVTPGTDALERPGRSVITAGWGSTIKDPGGPGGGGPGTYTPDRMREVVVPIVSNDECRVAYPELKPEFDVCAGRDGKDSCQGDSGGPLFVKVPGTENFIQLGVVSRGIGCGARGYPGVYARLSGKTIGDWVASFGNDPALARPGTA